MKHLIVAGVVLVPGLLFGSALNEAEAFHRKLDSYPVVAEIDTATEKPVHQFPPNASLVTNILGQPARLLPPGAEPAGMAWVIGKGAELKPGEAYVLSLEFPDDVSRSIFIANRGADHVRGFATGKATGDVRRQYTQPSLESLDYPQSGTWQRYRSLFILHQRFQGLKAQRDPSPGGRPFTPAEGFHVIVFQSQHINDPRSHGAAVGKIRLHRVSDLNELFGGVPQLPEGLPRRHVFFREEMADEAVSAARPEDRACEDPVDWFVWKARVSKALGFNTFAKDLLEFGHNQGWESGDQNWLINAQPPLTDVWGRMVPKIAAEGLELLPYYEYKGALGWSGATQRSLGWQRRAQKLYHGLPNTNYTGVWWVEQHNADLTDPDTAADARKVLDVSLLKHRDKAQFMGAWFRTRGNHLPISFAGPALERFRSSQRDPARKVTRETLIESYEGDRKLYEEYVRWWFGRRAAFLSGLQAHLQQGLQQSRATLLFTPWPDEAVPLLRHPRSGDAGHPVQITTDEVPWWDQFARAQTNESWFRWAYSPTSFDDVVRGNMYARSLRFQGRIDAPHWSEAFHAAPYGDPQHYRNVPGVMITFPIGRLFTVADRGLLEEYQAASGLTVLRHYTLNEDNPKDQGFQGPFGGGVGYACVDVDRAGAAARLLEARTVAHGDPVNIGYLAGSAFSTGFPGYVRQFHRAFLAAPALPSRRLDEASTRPEVVVREASAAPHGAYYSVVNTSMHPQAGVEVKLPPGQLEDLLTGKKISERPLKLTLHAGELRSYRLAP